jgi:hypothetical protein
MNGATELLGYAHHHWARLLEEKLCGDVRVPLHDQDAYLSYPKYRWMFNKLLICHAQGIPAFPHGVDPCDVGEALPVFSKPMMNLWGLSTGSRRIEEWTLADYRAGHFWMPFLPGRQLSTDVVVLDGRALWSYSMEPQRDENGSFVTWTSVSDRPPGVTRVIEAWVARHLSDFRGVVNFETIDEVIIEAPPRMAVQFIDFYGRGWLDAVVRLCSQGTWQDPGPAAPEGVSYVLRLPAAAADSHPRLVNRIRVIELERASDTSIYLPWQNGQRLGDSNDDDASFRLAIVNASTLLTAESVAGELLSYIDGLDVPAASRRSRERALDLVPA